MKYETNDLDHAAAMLSKGAKLGDGGWVYGPDRKITFKLEAVTDEMLMDYNSGRDGISAFCCSRRFLIGVVKRVERPKAKRD